ncbi:hypothetical protein [Bradyrhizobium sp. SZCCHNR3058]|uniref:hypothetical protein n=1 Tax=Bradyrhizobium sp. SZCCHNR3058 TaxID=3057423 RepID=UPI0029160A69|nr:hypothetical protein [Bradyrhizobium sp. SZCCHNR3058]
MSDFKCRARFIEARPGQCQFFLPGESGMYGLVCGDAARDNSSFCACHHGLVFVPQGPKTRINSGYFDPTVRSVEINDEESDLTELVL